MQEIADSLDLGLEVEEGKMAAAGRGREEGGTGHAPSRVIALGDVRSERRRVSATVKASKREEGAATGHALDREPSRVVGVADVREEKRRRESVGKGSVRVERTREESVKVEVGGRDNSAGLGEPNRVVSEGDWRLERRRRENVAVVLPVGKRRSVG